MADNITPGENKEQLARLYAKLGHLRARIDQMGPDEQGRISIYQKEKEAVVAKINELKGNK